MPEHTGFDRDKLEIFNWPALMEHFAPLARMCLGGGQLSRQLNQEAFMLPSLVAGCRHCQAHGGYGLHLAGVPAGRIQALWDFERSDRCSPAERTAYRFALAAGGVPGGRGPFRGAAPALLGRADHRASRRHRDKRLSQSLQRDIGGGDRRRIDRLGVAGARAGRPDAGQARRRLRGAARRISAHARRWRDGAMIHAAAACLRAAGAVPPMRRAAVHPWRPAA